MKGKVHFVFLLLVGLLIGCNGSVVEENADSKQSNDKSVAKPHVIVDSVRVKQLINELSDSADLALLLANTYRARAWHTIWASDTGWSEQAFALVDAVQNAHAEGVADSFPQTNRIQRLISIAHTEVLEQWETDLLLTVAFFWYTDRISRYQAGDAVALTAWYLPRVFPDMNAWLNQVVDSSKGSPELASGGLFFQYARLQKELRRMHRIMSKPGWFVPAMVEPNSPEESNAMSGALEERLRLFGDLPSEGPISTDQIKAAVRKFRRRHALQELGGIDSICLDLLNRNPEDVRKQLLVNLERCRWMPLPNAGRVLVVNVPDYKLYAIKDGVKIWEMPVVVGEELWPTVSFSGRLNQVVLNPYWVVPLTILQKELVQKIIADPNYLSINRFEVVGRSGRTVNPARINWQAWSKGSLPYELRQKPGNGNPLGKIKFYFPNNHAVYLHDTPSKALFDRSERGFSHGCIRLYDARKVLDFVLEESVNRISTVDALLSTGKEHWIPVQPAVPVRIVYFTAWVDRSGTLQIRKDLYQRDAVIAAKLIAQ